MPTLDDLRSVLFERESLAGDVDSIRAALDEPQRRHLVPVLAGAAVVVAAAGVGIAVTGNDSGHAPATGGIPSASSTPFTGTPAPATTAPAHQDTSLTWGFSVQHLDGYSAHYTEYTPYEQVAQVDGEDGSSALISVHPRGAFVVASDLHVGSVSVNGRPGLQARDRYVLWQYEPDSWATVKVGGGEDPAAIKGLALRLAQAVRFGEGAKVASSFALRDLPSRFLVEAVTTTGSQSCIGFGSGEAYPTSQSSTPDLGTALTACRIDDSATVLQRSWGADRTLTQDLADGTTLVLAVNSAHLEEVSQADLVDFAKHADTSPKPDDPSTWLPVRG